VREFSDNRSLLVAAGLEQALDYLESLGFRKEDLAWLAGTRRFSGRLIDHLSALRFTRDVHAMPEGTVHSQRADPAHHGAAAGSETHLINLLHFQTLIASKGARRVLVAGGRHLVDFGLRRAHGGRGRTARRPGKLHCHDRNRARRATAPASVNSFG
jgi:nicotinate phosphoribosyltransferase